MSKSIYEMQNNDKLLKCIVAQREEYSLAKRSCRLKLIISVAMVTLFTILSSVIDNDIISATSILLAFVLIIVNRHFDAYTSNHRKHAALIQQYIDVTMFSSILGRNDLEWGGLPTKTDLVESINSIEDYQLEAVKNWYSDYSTLEPACQVFYCQQENIRWDSKLRSEFMMFVTTVFSIVMATMIATALAKNPSVLKCISILAWILPIVDYGYGLFCDLKKDIARLKNLKSDSCIIEKLLINNDYEQCNIKVAELQRHIMDNRENSTLIPDWFYNLRKSKHQKSEDTIAKTLSKDDGDSESSEK